MLSFGDLTMRYGRTPDMWLRRQNNLVRKKKKKERKIFIPNTVLIKQKYNFLLRKDRSRSLSKCTIQYIWKKNKLYSYQVRADSRESIVYLHRTRVKKRRLSIGRHQSENVCVCLPKILAWNNTTKMFILSSFICSFPAISS